MYQLPLYWVNVYIVLFLSTTGNPVGVTIPAPCAIVTSASPRTRIVRASAPPVKLVTLVAVEYPESTTRLVPVMSTIAVPEVGRIACGGEITPEPKKPCVRY